MKPNTYLSSVKEVLLHINMFSNENSCYLHKLMWCNLENSSHERLEITGEIFSRFKFFVCLRTLVPVYGGGGGNGDDDAGANSG